MIIRPPRKPHWCPAWVWWELSACASLARDSWRSRTWPGWLTITGPLTLWQREAWAAFLAACAVVGFGGWWVAVHTTWISLTLWIAAVWAGFAAATYVARKRHYLRLDLTYAASSVTKGNLRSDPNAEQRHHKQPRPHMSWEFGTARLRSAVLPVNPSWRRGDDEQIDRLDAEIRRRLNRYGNYALDWPRNKPAARVRKVWPLPEVIEARHDWVPPKNIVMLGVTESTKGCPGQVGDQCFAPWIQRDDPHILAAGATGRGKTTMLRWLIYSLIMSAKVQGRGVKIYPLDGKGTGNLAFLENRLGVHGRDGFDDPEDWIETIGSAKAEMAERYRELRKWNKNAWREDPETYPEPDWNDDVIVVVDELVDIANIAGDDVIGPLSEICRLGREAGITVICSVLRPDTVASLPGLVRDQLTARLLLGSITEQTSARMMFGDDWRAARAAAGTHDGRIHGRGVVRLSDEMHRVQIPLTKHPSRDPRDAALWLPPRLPDGVADLTTARSAPDTITPRQRRQLAEAETLEKS